MACPFTASTDVKERDIEFISPDRPSRCTWVVGKDVTTSPHSIKPTQPRSKVMPNILHAIGNSPLVKLNKIPQSMGIKCDMYAKCEFLNPGGSVKDRIGYRMIEDAEAKGILKPGYVIIEPSSGNTGIGLAMASAIKGYKCIIVMPEKMSNEKVDTLRALGAEIVRTPTEAAFDSPEGLILVAHKLNKQIPNSVILDQYRNAGNPLAHYDGTGNEILDAFDGKLDMVVIGAGTGGTIAGVGRKIKERCPSCIVVGADPEGSILSVPEELNKTDTQFYEVEGIGYDFIPTVIDRSVVDKWIKSNDKAAMPMARRLIREEGLLCGGSSGTALSVALEAAKDLKEGQKCVVVLPDGVRNYMTKFVSDNWMEARDFKEVAPQNHWWWDVKASELPKYSGNTLLPTATCKETVDMMNNEKTMQLPIVGADGIFNGMATQNYLMTKIVNKRITFTDAINKALFKQFRKVSVNTSLGKIERILEKDAFVVITDGDKFVNIVTNMNLLKFISGRK